MKTYGVKWVNSPKVRDSRKASTVSIPWYVCHIDPLVSWDPVVKRSGERGSQPLIRTGPVFRGTDRWLGMGLGGSMGHQVLILNDI